MNPKVELFTTTGRMIVSEPPLQNLEHKIRLKRSWRLSLAEEMEADLPHVEVGCEGSLWFFAGLDHEQIWSLIEFGGCSYAVASG